MDELTRAVAALRDEDAGHLNEVIRERRRANVPGLIMAETTTSADGTVRIRRAGIQGDEGFAILMRDVCATWDEIQRGRI